MEDESYSLSTPIKEHSEQEWKNTLKKVLPAVINVTNLSVRAFECEEPAIGASTAFVIDKVRGIALTNRHCCTGGPGKVSLTFINGEKIPAHLMFADPLHDFAFLRFNPSAVKFMTLAEIQLDPKGAVKGLDIRVAGNDCREKLSIMKAVIADSEYLDMPMGFDSELFHVNCVGLIEKGSSGSPVVSIDGKAVGLVSRRTMRRVILLPMGRILDCLRVIGKGFYKIQGCDEWQWRFVKVPRKKLNATFSYLTPMELRYSPLLQSMETVIHNATELQKHGLIISGALAVGKVGLDSRFAFYDVLLKINGVSVPNFEEMERALDSLGDDVEAVRVQILRLQNNILVHYVMEETVLDMERVDQILEIEGSSIHRAPYHLNQTKGMSVDSVVVSEPGKFLINHGITERCVIQGLNLKPTKTFKSFLRDFYGTINQDKNKLMFHTSSGNVGVSMDNYPWKPRISIWSINHDGYNWTRQSIPFNNSKKTAPKSIKPLQSPWNDSYVRSCSRKTQLMSSMVTVNLTMPSYIDAFDIFHPFKKTWTGIIIHHTPSKGIVLVPNMAGSFPIMDTYVSIHSHCIKGDIIFNHPTAKFCLISYNPLELGTSAKYILPARLSPEPLRKNEQAEVVSFSDLISIHSVPCCVKSMESHANFYLIETSILEEFLDTEGIVVDKDYNLKSLYMGKEGHSIFALGIWSIYHHLNRLLPLFTQENPGEETLPQVYLPIFPANMNRISLQEAIYRGVQYKWVKKVLNHSTTDRHLLEVYDTCSYSSLPKTLQQGDIIVMINGSLVFNLEDIEKALQEGFTKLRILRNGKEVEILSHTNVHQEPSQTKIIEWCGGSIWDDYVSSRQARVIHQDHGVLVTFVKDGCPLFERFCPTGYWIVGVNGIHIRNFDHFQQVIAKLDDKEVCRLKVRTGFGIETWIVDLNLTFFPTALLSYDHVSKSWTCKFLGVTKREN